MTIPTLRGAFSNTALAAQTISPSFVLPSGLSDGDEAILNLSFNSGTATLNDAAGWTDVGGGPQTNSAGNLRSYLLKKTLAAADSGTTVTFGLTAGLRWTVGGVALGGSDMANMNSVAWLDNTDDLQLSIPAITPPAGKEYFVVTLAGVRYATTTTGVTPSGGWTERVDVATTNGTAPKFGQWVGSRTVALANNGAAIAAANLAYAANARNNAWVIAIPEKIAQRISERWNGSALVPVRADKWNGSSLVQEMSQV